MGEFTDEEGAISLCANCIDEDYLETLVAKEGTQALCDQCNENTLSMTLQDISRYVDTAFERHYQPGRIYPFTFDQAGDPPECLLADCTGINEKNCEIIRRIIEREHYGYEIEVEGEQIRFGDDSLYEARELTSHNLYWEWQEFEKLILSQARFFSSDAKVTLDKIFSNIETLKTKNSDPVVTIAGPGLLINTFYRGRYFHDDDEICAAMERPDKIIGPPPSHLAMSGRMNAKGISVFYGATDPQVALAEIRPPVGSRVVMAEFQPIKPMTLLNLSLLENSALAGSIFDPGYAEELSRIHFLSSLVTLMTRPTNPLKDIEYIPTQVIADYLANSHAGKFDGILYPSSQSKIKGLNVVLFHKSSKVSPLDIPNGMQFRSDTYEQYEEDYIPRYTVQEVYEAEACQGKQESETLKRLHLPQLSTDKQKEDNGKLRVNSNTLKVHEINPIVINTTEHDVERTRRKPYKRDF